MSDIHGPQSTPGTWNIVGTPDNDNLYGGKGDNHFDGGTGEDTVYYGGYADQIEVKFDAASQSYKIGNDTLKNVEYIQFSDGRMTLEEASRMVRPQYHVTESADAGKQVEVIGTDSGDRLYGGDGNDTLIGNRGDDALYGGKGEDAAVFSGNRADYDIRFDYNTNHYVVTDHQAGRDGKDTLWQIEQLKFADTTIQLHAINGVSGPPDEATVAKLDGVIEAPPPPPVPDYSEWLGHGELSGLIDNAGAITINDGAMVELFVVWTTATTTNADVVAIEVAGEPIALAGVPATFAFTGAGGIVFDAP